MSCTPHHDWFNAILTFGLCLGLVISYLPQHFRIIHSKSSEGFSPIFLLLGTTSAASGMLNMITLQAPIVKCCRVVSFGSCLEMSAGVIQVGLQWLCFTIVFILFLIYYPLHLKYVEAGGQDNEAQVPGKMPVKSAEWGLSITVAWIAGLHFFVIALTTAYFLHNVSDAHTISAWATFLGLTSAILAAIQYAPQLLHTYRTKLVGALSIPMMMIQSPGGILMVTSIALRPGTNWTSWITFAVAAFLQGCLLAMCIAWKFRQHKLHIDDFGNPLEPEYPPRSWTETSVPEQTTFPVVDDDPVPGLVTDPAENAIAVRVALANALETAVESNLLSPAETSERTPLLERQGSRLSNASNTKSDEGRWSAWFGR